MAEFETMMRIQDDANSVDNPDEANFSRLAAG